MGSSLFSGYQETLSGEEFRLLVQGRTVRIWGGASVVHAEVQRFVTGSGCDYEDFYLQRETLNQGLSDTQIEWEQARYFYVLASTTFFKKSSSMLLSAGLVSGIDFISFRKLRRHVVVIEGDSCSALPALRTGSLTPQRLYDSPKILKRLSSVFHDASYFVSKVELGMRYASSLSVPIVSQISSFSDVCFHINTVPEYLGHGLGSEIDSSKVFIYVHCMTPEDLSEALTVINSDILKTRQGSPSITIVLYFDVETVAEIELLNRAVSRVDKGFLHPDKYEALLGTGDDIVDQSKVEELVELAKLQAHKPCPCVRYFPVIGSAGDLLHCHNFGTELSSKGETLSEIAVNRQNSQTCKNCSGRGLHRLDLHLLNNYFGERNGN
jgi:hypothetical protein